MSLSHAGALLVGALLVGALLCGTLACSPAAPGFDAGEAPDGSSPDPEDAGGDGGGRDAGVPDAGFGPVPVEQWCKSKAVAECARDVRCHLLEPTRVADCVARAEAACDQDGFASGVRHGRLQYFAAQGGHCLDAYAHADCARPPAACESLFVGLVPADGGCVLEQDCAAGAYCQSWLATCPLRCAAYARLGEACNFGDHRCDPDTGCTLVDGGYQCVLRKGVGEACTFWDECRADLGCISNKCVAQRAKLGERCAEVSGYPLCEADLFCRQEPSGSAPPGPGTCQRRTGLGGVCAGYGSCLTGLRCSSAYQTGRCIPLGGEGEACTHPGDCQRELYCAPPTARCTALPGDGGDCSSKGSSYSCAVGHYCEVENRLDRCTPLKRAGERCGYDAVCQSDTCEFGPLPDGGYAPRCVERCSRRMDGGS